MTTPISLFDYHLPDELIAQSSVEPRDHSRLMVIDRKTGTWKHQRFYEIIDTFEKGDVLVMNNTKVFRARLSAQVNGKDIELFLLRPRDAGWDVLVKPGRVLDVGDTIVSGTLQADVLSKKDVAHVQFNVSDEEVIDHANKHGEIPIPPYVHTSPKTLDQYQTVYAQKTGSVAAPTAGFHFTNELLEAVREKGVEVRYVTLHVGIGTFRPIKTETLEDHQMHSEFVQIDEQTAQAINAAKQENRRIIAVGTTTVRTLEGVHDLHKEHFRHGEVLPPGGFSGDVNLFITPGFAFNIIDGLITNFHLPKSTLLVLVSAFAGRENMLRAYKEAVDQKYRFFSFGDAMFIA